MKIDKEKLLDKIFLLRFPTQHDVTSTMLRFQEFYESPKFRGKYFTLDEFKAWYSKNGEFTYYTDWHGFNMPSEILKPFYEGKFDPLSDKERAVLDLFSEEEGNFYILAGHGKLSDGVFEHEIAHALWFLDDDYRSEIKKILDKHDVSGIRKELIAKDGYHVDVLDDEVHAWVLHSSHRLSSEIPKGLEEELLKTFDKYKEKYGKISKTS